MAAFVLRTAAIACKKKAVIQPKCKHPSFTCDSQKPGNNIHPLKFDEVRHGQCLSMSATVYSSRSKPPAVNSSQMGSQASAPPLPHPPLRAKLMSTTDVIRLQGCGQGLTMKCIQSPILNNLDARNTAEAMNSNQDWSQSIWNTVHWSVETNISGAAIPQSKMDTTHTSNALKCVQTSSATCLHVLPLFLRRAQKASPEPPRTNSIRWALMPLTLTPMECRWGRFQIQMRDRTIWSSTSPPVPSRMQLCKAALRFHRRLTPQHLLTLDPSPPHLGPFITAASPLTAKLISTTDLLDFKAVAKAWPKTWNLILMHSTNWAKYLEYNPSFMPAGKG